MKFGRVIGKYNEGLGMRKGRRSSGDNLVMFDGGPPPSGNIWRRSTSVKGAVDGG